MCNYVVRSPYVERSYFSPLLYKQLLQKIAHILFGFRLREGEGIHVFYRNINFLRNNIFLRKKVNVHFYMGEAVFFSWSLSL